MDRTVFCQKLDKKAPALGFAPLPGPLGKKIYDNICAEAWQNWLKHQTMLINEKRLSMGNAEHRKYLSEQMEKYFFGEGADMPEGYTPPAATE